MEVTLPKKGTYKISALVNNTSLDENSLVWAGDKIRPHCDSSLAKDPDVSGLLVLIQNAQKETVGRRIHYTLKNLDDFGFEIPEEENADPEEIPADFELEEEAAEERNNDEKIEYETVDESEGEAEVEAYETYETDFFFDDAEYFVEDEDFFDFIANEDFENPSLPLSITDIEDTVFRVKSLDSQLPIFTLPEELEVGLYTLVFKVLGDKETFSEIEQSFFYLGNSRFALKDLNLYLPGVYAESRLIRPGTKVLLEAVIETERNINPYIVWYNGKKIIAEGFISDGTGVIFFEAPEQNALQTVRAEIFPTQARQGMSGISQEIVLPVSAKADEPEFFSGAVMPDFLPVQTKTEHHAANLEAGETSELSGPELIHWYQFAGTLDDANDLSKGRNKLVPVVQDSGTGRQPRFSPMEYTYGLSTGAYEAYALPEISFARDGVENGGGAFLFRIKPVSSGSILNVIFDSPAVRQVSMHLLAEEDSIVLRLNAGEDLTSEMKIPAGKGTHVTAMLMFYLLPDRLEAKLIPEKKSPEQVEPIYVRLREPLGGKCSVRLGSQNVSARERGQNRSGDQSRTRYSGRRNIPAIAIWNELAVFYLNPTNFNLLEPLEPEVVEEAVADFVREETVVEPVAAVTTTVPVSTAVETPPVAAEVVVATEEIEAAVVTEEEVKQAETEDAELQEHAVEIPEVETNDNSSKDTSLDEPLDVSKDMSNNSENI